MFCPIRALCAEISNECAEKKCAFWYNNECVIAGFFRSFIKGEPPAREDVNM